MTTPIRSGNYERGWNDPPVFGYTDQVTATAAASERGGPSLLQLHRSSPRPVASPDTTSNRSALSASDGPPKAETSDLSSKSTEVYSSNQSEMESVDQESLLNNINHILDECEIAGMKKVLRKEMDKKLEVLKKQLFENALPLEVERRLSHLISFVKGRSYEEADVIQKSLVVDFSREVCAWMVAIRKLMMTSKDMRPPSNSDGEVSISQPVTTLPLIIPLVKIGEETENHVDTAAGGDILVNSSEGTGLPKVVEKDFPFDNIPIP